MVRLTLQFSLFIFWILCRQITKIGAIGQAAEFVTQAQIGTNWFLLVIAKELEQLPKFRITIFDLLPPTIYAFINVVVYVAVFCFLLMAQFLIVFSGTLIILYFGFLLIKLWDRCFNKNLAERFVLIQEHEPKRIWKNKGN
uniref:RING-CH-type domain-containing protein n=1 Tax=Acrobeloides nanus TaxID=290746 RepID=A0A914CWY2_9BILA